MDNQQALTEIDKAWLSGFFDGEGHVDLNVCQNGSAKKRNTARQWIMIPRLVAVNTHYPTVMRWKELFEIAGVGVHIQSRKRNNPKHKPCWVATIQGHKRCLKAAPILLAHSITKKKSLEIMIEWLKHRDETWSYSLRDYDLYLAMKKEIGGKGPNDSTLRHIYESCTSPKYVSETRGTAA